MEKNDWRSLPKAAKALQVGQDWLRQEVLKAYNYPVDSSLVLGKHWRKVGTRYQINVVAMAELFATQHPPPWEITIKRAVSKSLKKHRVSEPRLIEEVTASVLQTLKKGY